MANMSRMFVDCASFNVSLAGFDTSKVTNLQAMFAGVDWRSVPMPTRIRLLGRWPKCGIKLGKKLT